MIRLAIVVEGKTERRFVEDLLALHLSAYGVSAETRLIGRPGRQGGDVTVERIAYDVHRLWHEFDAVTTLVDFYGFRARPADDVVSVERLIDQVARAKIGERQWRADRNFAYVQQYEFEALLFSDVDAFRMLPVASKDAVRRLKSVRRRFQTPEDINDSAQTAPSKRIKQAIPGYGKPEHGLLVAAEIGLETMRQECPRFADWLTRLERLA